jgi:hypothetical protein
MNTISKAVGAIGLAGALALTATTPSSADDRWAYAAGGFALGAVVGAAATANTRAYYGSPYYDSYAYESAYVAPAPAYTYAPAPVYTYSAPAYSTYSAPAYSYPAYDAYAYSPGYVAPAPMYVGPRFRSWREPSYNHFDSARGNIGG